MSSRVLQGLAWLVRQTFRTMSNSGSQTISLTTSTIGEEVRTTSPPAPRQSGGSSDKPSTKGVDLTENDCRTALTQDGLSNGTDDDIEFLKSALIGQDQPKGLSLRKFGAALTADELRGLGYRANLVLSHECLAILTPKGRSDSAESAQFIVSAVTSRAAKRRDILRQIDALGPGTMVRIIPNAMASGPCPACITLSKRRVPIEESPLGPLAECPHPSQCVLHSRTVSFPLAGEMFDFENM